MSEDDTAAKGRKLAMKLIDAALDVETVGKRGENEAQHYTYARAEDIAAAATEALLKQNVLVEFEVERVEQTPISSGSGRGGMIATVTAWLRITDADTGYMVKRSAMGSGSDWPGDKAIYKAMTGARKYAFIHLLGIPIGDDPDEVRGQTRREALGPKLDPEKVKELVEFCAKHSMTLKQIDEALGAAGLDALRARSKKAVLERFETLSVEQADAFEQEVDGDGDQG